MTDIQTLLPILSSLQAVMPELSTESKQEFSIQAMVQLGLMHQIHRSQHSRSTVHPDHTEMSGITDIGMMQTEISHMVEFSSGMVQEAAGGYRIQMVGIQEASG